MRMYVGDVCVGNRVKVYVNVCVCALKTKKAAREGKKKCNSLDALMIAERHLEHLSPELSRARLRAHFNGPGSK